MRATTVKFAGTTRRGVVLAASAALHAVLLAWILWQLDWRAPPAQVPAVNVQLVRLRPPPARRPASPARGQAQRPAPHNPRIAPPPTIAPAPLAPVPEAPSAEAAGRGVLRGLLGCRNADLLALSPAERARCREALARADARDSAARLNLDPTGRFVEDAEPYLARRPKKGCKPRAGGDVTPSGDHGVAGGITCAVPF